MLGCKCNKTVSFIVLFCLVFGKNGYYDDKRGRVWTMLDFISSVSSFVFFCVGKVMIDRRSGAKVETTVVERLSRLVCYIPEIDT